MEFPPIANARCISDVRERQKCYLRPARGECFPFIPWRNERICPPVERRGDRGERDGLRPRDAERRGNFGAYGLARSLGNAGERKEPSPLPALVALEHAIHEPPVRCEFAVKGKRGNLDVYRFVRVWRLRTERHTERAFDILELLFELFLARDGLDDHGGAERAEPRTRGNINGDDDAFGLRCVGGDLDTRAADPGSAFEACAVPVPGVGCGRNREIRRRYGDRYHGTRLGGWRWRYEQEEHRCGF